MPRPRIHVTAAVPLEVDEALRRDFETSDSPEGVDGIVSMLSTRVNGEYLDRAVPKLRVVANRTEEKDGYTAVQVGFEEAKKQNVNKAQAGHYKKAGLETMPKIIREFRVEELPEDRHHQRTPSGEASTILMPPAATTCSESPISP